MATSSGISSFIHLDGRLLTREEAIEALEDRPLFPGCGLYENVNFYPGGPLWFNDHIDRLFAGAGDFGLLVSASREEIARAIRRLLRISKLKGRTARVRISLHSNVEDDPTPVAIIPTLLISAFTVPYSPKFSDGVSLVTLDFNRGEHAAYQTTASLPIMMGIIRARRAEADEALFCDGDHVLEGTRSNIFAVINKKLVTPPADGRMLDGIARRKLIRRAREKNVIAVERPITRAELHEADEAFMTNTIDGVYPVRSIDGRELPNKRRPFWRMFKTMFNEVLLSNDLRYQ